MFNTPADFIAALNEAFKDTDYSFEVMTGSKYTRVVATSPGSRSAFCFIDREGNVYKTASWKIPAKGVRAKLSTLTQTDIANIRSTGYASTGWLYRNR